MTTSDNHSLKFMGRVLVAGGAVFVLCAATPVPNAKKLSVELSDVGPLQQQVTASAAQAPAAQPQATMQRTMFQPAPTPDPDASGPDAVSAAPRASVVPTLLSEKREFEGEGYSYSSSQQGALDHRTQPAAGLGINVPVQQQLGHQPLPD